MKKYKDSTLNSLTKAELINYIRTLEHNLEAAEATINNQANFMTKLFEDEYIDKKAKRLSNMMSGMRYD